MINRKRVWASYGNQPTDAPNTTAPEHPSWSSHKIPPLPTIKAEGSVLSR
jgi:hypothetical protein